MKSDIQTPNFWRKNWDSTVSIVTRLREKAKELTLDSQQGQEIFLFSRASRLALLTTQPPFQCILEVKQPVYEADHRPPSSIEVKNVWSCTSIPPCHNGIKRDKVTFTLILEENAASIFLTGRRFLQKVSTCLQTTWCHIPESCGLSILCQNNQKFMHTQMQHMLVLQC